MLLGNNNDSSVVMFLLLIGFALIHSGGAALRERAERVVGARVWRLIFASVSIPSALILIGYFLAHRYDGFRILNLQGIPVLIPILFLLNSVSFFFLYPATYNLLEIPAIKKPQVKLYETGIIRISRHPQAIGQIIWCFAHFLWIGSSFMLVTCFGLIGHHLFAIWHGDQRLRKRFGDSFEELKSNTSVIPFLAVIDGRQKLQIKEFLRPSQLGIVVAIIFFWWAHQFISIGSQAFLSIDFSELLNRNA